MSSLPDALRSYAALDLDCTERLKRLEADFGMRVGKTALAKLNKQFGVPATRPRASSITSHAQVSSSHETTMNSTTSNKGHKAANRISFICDELSSEKPTRSPSLKRSENTHKRKHDTENQYPTRSRTSLDHLHTHSANKLTPNPTVVAPTPARNRWWYAQHADLKLELNEMMTGFALDVLKRQKMADTKSRPKPVPSVKRASTVRRPFGELSRPITVGN